MKGWFDGGEDSIPIKLITTINTFNDPKSIFMLEVLLVLHLSPPSNSTIPCTGNRRR
jgi:hypothetical protein